MSLLLLMIGSLFLMVSGKFFYCGAINKSIREFLVGAFCAIAGDYFIIATIGRAYIG